MAVPPVFVSGQVLTAAEMNKIGLWVVKAETAFSGASTVTADNIFTADFTNYRLVLKYTTSTTNDISFRLRVGGVSAATNYNYQFAVFTGTTSSIARTTSATGYLIAPNTNGDNKSLSVFDISGPQLAEATVFNGSISYPQGGTINLMSSGGNHTTATAYDGMELLVASGTMTGSYTVYGYRE